MLILFAPLSKQGGPLTEMLETGAITSVVTLLLTFLFVRWDGLRLRDVGTSPNVKSGFRLIFGFIVGIAIVLLQEIFLYSGGHVHWAFRTQHFSPGIILLALAGYFVIALREELAFRGYSLRRIEMAKGLWVALAIMEVAFTLEHAAGGWTWSHSVLGPPAGALLFGMAALATRGIAVPLGVHAAFNFGQWFMGQKGYAGPLRLVVDAGFTRQAEVLGYAGYLTGTLLAAAGFWLFRKYRSSARPCNRHLFKPAESEIVR